MKAIKEFIFGKRLRGEKVVIPSLPPERPFNAAEFCKWCQEFRVSCLANRSFIN